MKPIWKSVFLLLLIFLSSCGGQQESTATPIDPVLLVTSAVQTVAAQLTQTAQAIPSPTAPPTLPPPTATMIPGLTEPPAVAGTPATTIPVALPPTQVSLLASPTAFSLATTSGPICDNAILISDVTIPDGTKIKPKEEFKKIWRIQNTGVCTWDEGYSLVYAYGDGRLSGNGFSINDKKEITAPGGTLDVGMKMVAPENAGTYSSCWRMQNDRNVLFGTAICVVIEVAK